MRSIAKSTFACTIIQGNLCITCSSAGIQHEKEENATSVNRAILPPTMTEDTDQNLRPLKTLSGRSEAKGTDGGQALFIICRVI